MAGLSDSERLSAARAAWAGCAGRLMVGHRTGCAAVRGGRIACDCDALKAREALAKLRASLEAP